MPQNMKEWRHKAKARLKEQLGGRCVDCGSTVVIFDHVIPLTDEQSEHRAKIGSNSRLVMYRKEAKEGLLCLRCQSCNVKKAREPKQGTLEFLQTLFHKTIEQPY